MWENFAMLLWKNIATLLQPKNTFALSYWLHCSSLHMSGMHQRRSQRPVLCVGPLVCDVTEKQTILFTCRLIPWRCVKMAEDCLSLQDSQACPS